LLLPCPLAAKKLKPRLHQLPLRHLPLLLLLRPPLLLKLPSLLKPLRLLLLLPLLLLKPPSLPKLLLLPILLLRPLTRSNSWLLKKRGFAPFFLAYDLVN
jgi:hypothetical protein